MNTTQSAREAAEVAVGKLIEPLLSILPDFQVRQHGGNAERSHEYPDVTDLSDEPVADQLPHDAPLSQPFQEHAPTDCRRAARQQAESPYCPQDPANFPDSTSESYRGAAN